MQQKTMTSIQDDAWSGATAKPAAVSEYASEAVLVMEGDGNITYVSAHADTLFGYSRDELVGESLGVLASDRGREQLARRVRSLLRQPEMQTTGSQLNTLFRRKGGENISVSIALHPAQIHGALFVIATIRQRTEQVSDLKALEESLDTYRWFLDNTTEAFWRIVFDPPIPLDLPEMEQVERALRDGYYTDTNLAFSRYYGYSEAGIMDGVRIEETLPRDDPATVPTILQAVRARFRVVDLVSFERDRGGMEKVFENSFIPDIVDEKVRSVWGTARDVSEQHRIARDNQIKSSALDLMIDGCAVVDAEADDLPIIYANKRFVDLTGYSHDEILGRSCPFLQVPETNPVVVNEIHECIDRGLPFEQEVLSYRKDGTPFLSQLRISPVKDRLGKVIRFVGHVHDVTEERRSARELRKLTDTLSHLTRVATIGELSAAIAHEINQPLTANAANISAGRRFIERDDVNLGELAEILMDIGADERRAAEVIRGLQKLVRKESASVELVDINELTMETLSLLHSDFVVRQIFVRHELARDLPAAPADRVQIQQVILNLLVNAASAVDSLESKRRQISVRTSHEPERGVCFAVRDYGEGISEESKAKLFEPFFTTKPEGLGTGLAINRTIIEAHGGEIWAENNKDFGATVSFTLPLTQT